MSVNTVALSGHLVENATLRSTKGGTMVLNFTVAVTERVRGADGGYEDRPSYIDCAVFGARAEAISRYLTKGGARHGPGTPEAARLHRPPGAAPQQGRGHGRRARLADEAPGGRRVGVTRRARETRRIGGRPTPQRAQQPPRFLNRKER